MALTLLMATLLGVAVSYDCFIYSCESLGSGVCAVKQGASTVYINDDGGCDCTVRNSLLVYIAYQSIGSTIQCSTEDEYFSYSYSYDNSYYDNYDCGIVDRYVELDSGIYPKKCNDGYDCLLENGDYNSCYCAYDGNSYCVPELGSSVYDDYWTGCAENNGDEIVYGLHYYSIYPLQVNSPSCAYDIVNELVWFSKYADDLSSAVGIAFSVIGALAVLY
jgi:hypothetical protein